MPTGSGNYFLGPVVRSCSPSGGRVDAGWRLQHVLQSTISGGRSPVRRSGCGRARPLWCSACGLLTPLPSPTLTGNAALGIRLSAQRIGVFEAKPERVYHCMGWDGCLTSPN